MSELKVGDHVEVETLHGTSSGKLVICTNDDGLALVEFDEYDGRRHVGVSNSPVCTKGDGYYWWCAKENMKLLLQEEIPVQESYDDELGFALTKTSTDTTTPKGIIGTSLDATAASILGAGLQHMQDRASTYDKPEGERSMDATVKAFNAITGHTLSEEEGWLILLLLKAVRSQQGALKMDSYEDGAAYFGLMGEAAYRKRNNG